MGLGAETIDLIRNAAAGLAKFDGKRIRAWRGKAPGFDRAIWRQMGEQGWLSMLVPEEDGGLNLGLAPAAAVAEELGRACAPEPFVMGGVLAPALLAHASNQDLKRDLLPDVLSGARLVAVAWQPPSGALDPEATAVAARREGDSIVLSGECRFIQPAHADGYLVLARAASGAALIWLEPGDAGVAVTDEPGPDGVPSARLRLADVRLPETRVLLGGNRVNEAVQATLDQAVIVQCAELCGLMQRAFDMTLDYLRTRQQFGTAIGAFQALQHRSVDLYIQQELARHATSAALRAPAGSNLAIAASSAKARAAQAGLLIATQAIQLHGAIGLTDEYDLGLYVNRIVRLVATLGNTAWHRRRYAELTDRLTARVAEGAQR